MLVKNPVPSWVRGLFIGGWIATLLWLESRHRLRTMKEAKLPHDLRNFAIAATAGAVMQLAEVPVAFHLSALAQEKGWGLLPRLPLLPVVRGLLGLPLGLLALDYTLYWWHFLTHRVPFLWRFHQVHHTDRDMDSTTALRFHFGEISISVLFRAAQMVIIGPTPLTVGLWQLFLFGCILFHHSNLRLPITIERRLARLLITPRLHGIHHSVGSELVNSNWSSGLTLWDWLHATLRTDAPQSGLVLGVPGLLDRASSQLLRSLALPFVEPASVPPYQSQGQSQPIDQLA